MLSGTRQKIRYFLRDAGALAGFNRATFRSARGAGIVVYHGVCQKDHTRYNNIFLKLKTFEEHLRYYKKYFNVISLDDFYERRFDPNRFNLCISFDDGYENNYHYVLPLLEKYELPAVFFITTIRQAGYDILWNDFLCMLNKYGPRRLDYKDEIFQKGKDNFYFSRQDGKTLMDKLRSTGFAEKATMMQELYPLAAFRERRVPEEYWRQMTESQIHDLAVSRWVTIGSHGFYHNDLGRLPVGDVEAELKASKKCLENWTGKAVSSLAFPYGTYSQPAITAALNAGYKQLLALTYHHGEDHENPAMRQRIFIDPYISTENQLLAIIKRTNTI